MFSNALATLEELKLLKRICKSYPTDLTGLLKLNQGSQADFLVNVLETVYDQFDAVANDECETWFFYHKDFDRFYSLCRQLESRLGITPENNSFRDAACDAVCMLYQAEIWESCPGSFEIRSEIGEDRHSVLYIQYYYGSGFWLEDDLVNLMIDIVEFFRHSVVQLRKRINEFDYRLFHYALPPRTFKEADE